MLFWFYFWKWKRPIYVFLIIYLFLPFFLCLALFCSKEALWQVRYNSWKRKETWFHLCSEAILRKCCGVQSVIVNSWFPQHFSHVLNTEKVWIWVYVFIQYVQRRVTKSDHQELEFSLMFQRLQTFFVGLESFNELGIPTLTTFSATDKHAPHIWGSSVPQFQHDNIPVIIPLQQVISQSTATLFYVNVFFFLL